MTALNFTSKRLNNEAGQEIVDRYEQGRRVSLPKRGRLKHDSGVDGTLSLPMPAPFKVYAYLSSAKEVLGGHNVQPITPRGTNIGPYEADWGGFSINAAKKGEPELRTYQIFLGEDGYTDDTGHGWQIWPLIHITMHSKLPQQVPGLKQDPPPLATSAGKGTEVIKPN